MIFLLYLILFLIDFPNILCFKLTLFLIFMVECRIKFSLHMFLSILSYKSFSNHVTFVLRLIIYDIITFPTQLFI